MKAFRTILAVVSLAIASVASAALTNAKLGATDSAGNFIAASNIGDTSSNFNTPVYRIVKRLPSGTIQWTKTYSFSSTQYAYTDPVQIKVDASDNIYVAGYTRPNPQGGGTPDSMYFLQKYNSAGSLQWTKTSPLGNGCVTTGLDLDSSGNAYLLGYKINSTGQTFDNQVYKYTPSGSSTSVTISAPTYTILRSIAINAGLIYVAGYTSPSVSGTSSSMAVCAKIYTSLQPGWLTSESLGPTGNYLVFAGIGFDPSGNPITGYSIPVDDPNNIGSTYYTNVVKSHSYITGAQNWSTSATVNGNSGSGGLIVDPSGNVEIAGQVRDSTDITKYDCGLMRFSSSGTNISNTVLNFSPGSFYPTGLAQDAGGSYLVAGSYSNPSTGPQVRVLVFDNSQANYQSYYYASFSYGAFPTSLVPSSTSGDFYIGGYTYANGDKNAYLFQVRIYNGTGWSYYYNGP